MKKTAECIFMIVVILFIILLDFSKSEASNSNIFIGNDNFGNRTYINKEICLQYIPQINCYYVASFTELRTQSGINYVKKVLNLKSNSKPAIFETIVIVSSDGLNSMPVMLSAYDEYFKLLQSAQTSELNIKNMKPVDYDSLAGQIIKEAFKYR